MVQVTAGWALFGKRPGSSDDYGVLNSSREPFTQAGFTRIIRRYGLGTPPAHRTGEGALPWVTISWVGEAPDRYLGMSIEDWTEHRDGSGRPVAFTKYICVPYQEVEAAPVSYTALYRELLRLDLPMDGAPGERVTLVTPEYSPADLARDIDRFDRQKVMRTAALLLDGRVDVVHAGEATLLDRLTFLDAVAALLPYGYRADFTGATWAAGAAGKIRLAFTRRARDGAREVSWRGPAEATPLSKTASGYLRLLNELLMRNRDLAWLVGYLAADSEPRDFGDPRHALRRLSDVEWPRAVAQAVRAGSPGLADEIRRLLVGPRLQEIAPADQSRVLGCLIREGEPDDLPLVERRWDQAAPTGGIELTEALVDAAARLLWREEPDGRVSRYAAFAAQRRLTDPFLAGLVRRGETASPSRPARALAAELIRDHVDPSDPSSAGSHLLTVLDRNHALAAVLLASEHRGPERIAAWVGWLSGRLRDMLPPFRDVLAGKEVRAAVLGGFADGQPEWASALIRVTGRLGRLNLVLPGLLSWLGGRASSTASRTFARGVLGDLETDERGGQGATDALLLMLGAPPRFLANASGAADFAMYEKGFLWAWLNCPVPSMAGTMVHGLADALRSRPWAGDPDRADAVINLARGLLSQGEQDWTPLIWVLDAEPPDPDLVARPAFGELRKRLRENEAAHRPAELMPASGMTPPGPNGAAPAEGAAAPAPLLTQPAPGAHGPLAPDAGFDEVAKFYLDVAMRPWGSAATALMAVADAGRPLTAEEAYTLMKEVEYAVAYRYDRDQADRYVRHLTEAVIGGTLGVDVAAEFRAVLADFASQEVVRQVALIEAAGMEVPGQPGWEPSEQVRTRLDEIKSSLERVAKIGRGGLRRLRRNRPDG
ncbi:hypothetical protein [Actinomadura rubrisoli]|uniref:Uncharacterized protein n=1 Tax=Actinomadura rubrisoli TaxID=2530368 RepID=A0A4V2YXK5_9ACTN|nr:hypothetical protein [Actinomadura rubrisoli]TDD89837.1 hypothetical protein E1298_13665 [Actinomadura rubrisoli]